VAFVSINPSIKAEIGELHPEVVHPSLLQACRLERACCAVLGQTHSAAFEYRI